MNDEFDRESARPRMSAARSDDDDIREGDPPTRRRDKGYDDDDDMDDLRRPPVARSGANVTAPAICMLVVAVLGLMLNVFGCVFAAVTGPQPPDPNLPPAFQEFMKNTHGPVSVAAQGFFALLSAITIVGCIQMLRLKSWGLGMTASIISMANIGNCCCLLGLPFGIWALISLLKPEVKDAFS